MTGALTTQIYAQFSEKLMKVSIAKKDSDFTKMIEGLGQFGITGT